MNLLNKLKSFTIENEKEPIVLGEIISPDYARFLKRFCNKCDKYFKTAGAKNAHQTIKHVKYGK